MQTRPTDADHVGEDTRKDIGPGAHGVAGSEGRGDLLKKLTPQSEQGPQRTPGIPEEEPPGLDRLGAASSSSAANKMGNRRDEVATPGDVAVREGEASRGKSDLPSTPKGDVVGGGEGNRGDSFMDAGFGGRQ
ncbi:hypothetical protein QOT17_018519 [Balamuthia mandrillaris]